MTTARSRAPQVLSVQYLRAVAAIAVVIFHLVHQINVNPWVSRATSALFAGVDLFFCISGFVMAWTILNSPPVSPAEFMQRRLIRIIPLYWTFTTVMLALLLFMPQLLHTAKFSLPHVIGSYLFIPVINPATGLYEPLAIPGWTLNYEMAFYGLFAAAMWLAKSNVLRTILISALLIIVLVVAGQMAQAKGVAAFYTAPLILEFVLGMTVGVMANRSAPVPLAVLIIVAVLAGLVLFWPGGQPSERALRRGAPAAILLGASAWMRVPNVRYFRTIGDASYAIYLSHIATAAVVVRAAASIGLLDEPLTRALTLIGGTLTCIIVGVVVWHVVERPLTHAVRSWVAKSTTLPHEASSGG